MWAIHLDLVTHEAIEIRSFAVSNSAWALDPVIAQDNDWEDITVGRPEPPVTAARLATSSSARAESLVQAPDAQGVPHAYFVTRCAVRVLSRSLDVSTGLDPQTSTKPCQLFQ